MNIGKNLVVVIAVALMCLLASLWSWAAARHTGRVNDQQSGAIKHDDAGAAAAFEAMVVVLHHPRCMNCHSKGDFPRQGDDGHRHTMDVRRGAHGNGVAGMSCSTCHQDFNLEGLHVPPGAPAVAFAVSGNADDLGRPYRPSVV